MPNPTLGNLRNEILDSIKGRKLGLNPSNFLQGQHGTRDPQSGLSATTTLMSTATAALVAYGMSMVGSTLTSGATAYTLADPIPQVRKTLFNPTTGTVTVTALTATIVSTASAGSTLSIINFVGKGAMADLIGISTSQYALLTPLAITTVTTGNLIQLV